MPFVGSEIHGGFFEGAAVVVAETRRDDNGDVGDGECHVRNDDGGQSEGKTQEAEDPLE